MSIPWWEFIIRGLCVYFFLLIALRFSGKKQVRQFSSFDFVLLLIISDAVQNSMTGGDNSLVGGLIIAGTLVGLNWTLDYLGYKNKKFAHLMEGAPEVLINKGKINHQLIKRERISDDEFAAILRNHGLTDASEVEIAVIEVNGDVNVIKEKDN